MSIEIKIPNVGESIQEVQIARWFKQEGDAVDRDEDLAELESEKASIELPAPEAGVLSEILVAAGETATVGQVVARLDKKKGKKKEKQKEKEKAKQKASEKEEASQQDETSQSDEEESAREASEQITPRESRPVGGNGRSGEIAVTPSARRALRRYGLSPEDIDTSGSRIDYRDVMRQVGEEEEGVADEEETSGKEEQEQQPSEGKPKPRQPAREDNFEEAVPMSPLRRRIAQRLVEAQQTAALLTTFNEVDMSAVKGLRTKFRDRFQQRYGMKLGFMSFFVKAVIDALQEQPGLNARIRDNDIVYRNYYHVGIAIGSEKGLVVPVLRDADQLGFAEIEQAINDFAHRAQSGELKPDELQGGTFTISNGGIYGSLLSTPIVNPPQSGVLGMHAIEDRPVVRDGQIVIRPMMYVALTYDHRLIDGREAVTFLKRVKETIEDPTRILLEI